MAPAPGNRVLSSELRGLPTDLDLSLSTGPGSVAAMLVADPSLQRQKIRNFFYI